MRTVDPVRHRAKRRQIVSAAAELFADRGFDATSTAEICRAAATSSGNLFHYFSSKREIFYAILEDDGSAKTQGLAAAQAREDAWLGLLDAVELLAAPAAWRLGPALVMEAMVQARRDPKLAARLGRDEADERAAIASLVSRAQAAGQIDPALEARQTASWITALIDA